LLLRPLSLRRYARLIKRAGCLAAGREKLYRYDVHPKRLTLGAIYCGWTITPRHVTASAIAYSFGAGNDISFDLELIRIFGMQVHAFDPAPSVAAWVGAQRVLPEYVFHPYGLAAHDTSRQLFVPAHDGGTCSLRQEHRHVAGPGMTCEVHTLATITRSLGTPLIEILKMDVEGAEHDLISDIVECPAPIRQLLIEFHHRSGVESGSATVQAVDRLRGAGFQLFPVSQTSSEFSFLHRRCCSA